MTVGEAPTANARVMANSAWQLVTFAARTMSGLGVAVLVAHADGPRGLGVLQLSLTVMTLLAFAAGLGMPNLLAREVARRPADAVLWLESGMFLGLTASAVLTVGATGLWAAFGGQVLAAAALGVAALGFDSTSRLVFSYFWARERMALEAAATWVQEAAYLIGAALLLVTGHGVVAVLWLFLASRVLGAAAGWLAASRLTGARIVPRLHRAFARGTLRRTVPFAVDDAMSVVYIRADTLLVQAFRGPVAVGLYQAGTTLVLSLNILARMLNNALYAGLSRAWPEQIAAFGRLRDSSLRLLGAIGVPIAVGTGLLAGPLLDDVFGRRFGQATTCLVILALVIPVRMVGHTLGTALTAADLQTARTWGVTGAAALNIGVDLVLVPWLSFVGAAWGTVITETALVVVYARMLRRAAGPSALVQSLAVPAVATLPLAAAVLATRHGPLVGSVAAGAGGYLVGLLALAACAGRLGGGARVAREAGSEAGSGARAVPGARAVIRGYLRVTA